jgi:hypothetical protein
VSLDVSVAAPAETNPLVVGDAGRSMGSLANDWLFLGRLDACALIVNPTFWSYERFEKSFAYTYSSTARGDA